MDVWPWVWLLTVMEFAVAIVVRDSRCESEEKVALFLLAALVVGDAWSIYALLMIKQYIPGNLIAAVVVPIAFFAIMAMLIFGVWVEGLYECWLDRR